MSQRRGRPEGRDGTSQLEAVRGARGQGTICQPSHTRTPTALCDGRVRRPCQKKLACPTASTRTVVYVTKKHENSHIRWCHLSTQPKHACCTATVGSVVHQPNKEACQSALLCSTRCLDTDTSIYIKQQLHPAALVNDPPTQPEVWGPMWGDRTAGVGFPKEVVHP